MYNHFKRHPAMTLRALYLTFIFGRSANKMERESHLESEICCTPSSDPWIVWLYLWIKRISCTYQTKGHIHERTRLYTQMGYTRMGPYTDEIIHGLDYIRMGLLHTNGTIHGWDYTQLGLRTEGIHGWDCTRILWEDLYREGPLHIKEACTHRYDYIHGVG